MCIVQKGLYDSDTHIILPTGGSSPHVMLIDVDDVDAVGDVSRKNSSKLQTLASLLIGYHKTMPISRIIRGPR